jgi:xanthine dehydrogenase YagT iron-sulfur-binding subunit
VPETPEHVPIELVVNGAREAVMVDTRTTLLDLLREHLGLTGAKKGCDHGQCGSCTALLDGRRANSCLVLAVTASGCAVRTIEGVSAGGTLHPLQRSFLEHDAYQCGYCTPGQVCSAIGMLDEVAAGWPSAVTADLTADAVHLNAGEVRERMAGNLCRCAAYVNLVDAILDAAP